MHCLLCAYVYIVLRLLQLHRRSTQEQMFSRALMDLQSYTYSRSSSCHVSVSPTSPTFFVDACEGKGRQSEQSWLIIISAPGARQREGGRLCTHFDILRSTPDLNCAHGQAVLRVLTSRAPVELDWMPLSCLAHPLLANASNGPLVLVVSQQKESFWVFPLASSTVNTR